MRPARRIRTALAAVALTLASVVTRTAATSAPAHADECYTWGRSLSSGASGDDVAQLQIRVAGWAGYGVAGPATFAKIHQLQDADCSPPHFSYAEVDGGCGQGGYSGGSVSAATVRENLKRAMWRAEALRQRMGNVSLRVTSGFRSQACDRQVGGSGTAQHTYGSAIDLVGASFCAMSQQARYTGFGGIFGPGHPDHDDQVHVDIRAGRSWRAPDCGVSRGAEPAPASRYGGDPVGAPVRVP